MTGLSILYGNHAPEGLRPDGASQRTFAPKELWCCRCQGGQASTREEREGTGLQSRHRNRTTARLRRRTSRNG